MLRVARCYSDARGCCRRGSARR